MTLWKDCVTKRILEPAIPRCLDVTRERTLRRQLRKLLPTHHVPLQSADDVECLNTSKTYTTVNLTSSIELIHRHTVISSSPIHAIETITMALAPKFAGQAYSAGITPKAIHTLELCPYLFPPTSLFASLTTSMTLTTFAPYGHLPSNKAKTSHPTPKQHKYH